jgi:replicative DNA helicase
VRRSPIVLLTVADELDGQGLLAECGGPAYLTSLINQVPSSLNAAHYARIVKGESDRRKMIAAANRIAPAAYDSTLEPRAAFAAAETAWQETRGKVDSGRKLLDMQTMMSQAWERMDAISRLGRPPGIISNLLDLDRILHGFKKGQYYIVAGRPGDGKSAFLLTLARNFMKIERKSVLFFSIEMQESSEDGDMISGGEISARLLGMEANLDTTAISDDMAMFEPAKLNAFDAV